MKFRDLNCILVYFRYFQDYNLTVLVKIIAFKSKNIRKLLKDLVMVRGQMNNHLRLCNLGPQHSPMEIHTNLHNYGTLQTFSLLHPNHTKMEQQKSALLLATKWRDMISVREWT